MDSFGTATTEQPVPQPFPLGNTKGVQSRIAKETVQIIEDEPDILELVQYNLEREGYKVYSSADGEVGLQQAHQVAPDLILLDLMLPGMDGLTICRRLRESDATKHIPIMMLTAKGEESDIILGLEMGADDYVTKPFSPKELIARMRAVLRRTQVTDAGKQSNRIQSGPILLDEDRHEVYLHNELIKLTLAEYNLLRTMMAKPGRVFTREQLLQKITNGEAYVIDRNVDVHIRAIRKKLGTDADFIVTVRGVGYKCHD